MKPRYFFFIVLLTLMLPVAGNTQEKAKAIDSLAVELWPDYDRAAVLVLLTGTLPADTKLPATVIIPIPKAARLNAVARIDSTDGKMKDDLSSSVVPGRISFITPDLRFRVEYYLPYAVNNNQRTFTFGWSAAISVNKFRLRVQRPLSASQLTTKPSSISVIRGEDGFTYYDFPEQVVPAGQPFSVRVDYAMPTAQLSVERLNLPNTRAQESGSPSTKTGSGVNWLILLVILGGIIIIMVFVWKIATRSAESNRAKTQNASAKKESFPKFCSNCDNPAKNNDRYCSKCGASL
jgi:hypothetical protein